MAANALWDRDRGMGHRDGARAGAADPADPAPPLVERRVNRLSRRAHRRLRVVGLVRSGERHLFLVVPNTLALLTGAIAMAVAIRFR